MQKGREVSRSFELNIKLLYDRCTQKGAFFVFGTMCSACAERDVHFVRDVCFASDVRFARDKEHVTSLCAKGAIDHYGKAITSLRLAATSLFIRLAATSLFIRLAATSLFINDRDYAII